MKPGVIGFRFKGNIEDLREVNVPPNIIVKELSDGATFTARYTDAPSKRKAESTIVKLYDAIRKLNINSVLV